MSGNKWEEPYGEESEAQGGYLNEEEHNLFGLPRESMFGDFYYAEQRIEAEKNRKAKNNEDPTRGKLLGELKGMIGKEYWPYAAEEAGQLVDFLERQRALSPEKKETNVKEYFKSLDHLYGNYVPGMFSLDKNEKLRNSVKEFLKAKGGRKREVKEVTEQERRAKLFGDMRLALEKQFPELFTGVDALKENKPKLAAFFEKEFNQKMGDFVELLKNLEKTEMTIEERNKKISSFLFHSLMDSKETLNVVKPSSALERIKFRHGASLFGKDEGLLKSIDSFLGQN